MKYCTYYKRITAFDDHPICTIQVDESLENVEEQTRDFHNYLRNLDPSYSVCAVISETAPENIRVYSIEEFKQRQTLKEEAEKRFTLNKCQTQYEEDRLTGDYLGSFVEFDVLREWVKDHKELIETIMTLD